MILDEKDFPGTYLTSNNASLSAQKIYKLFNWAILFVMFGCIVVSNTASLSGKLEKLSGFFMLLTALASICLLWAKPEKNWYVGRAAAESVKTLAWRFMMRSEPFSDTDGAQPNRLFQARIDELALSAARENFTPVNKGLNAENITGKMLEVRNLVYDHRKEVYLKNRIEDQITWYSKKSLRNKKLALRFSLVIILLQLVAATYLVFFIDTFKSMRITDVVIFCSASLIAIVEMNKYKELHQSYYLTQLELTTIKERFSKIDNDVELDEFVNEAEQAISREHTMWLARRGSSDYLKNNK